MGPSSVLARRPPPPEHHCPSTSRAAAKFSVYVVESWQKSRPPGRRRVESGAAEQGCYKEAFAHGLEEERKRHDGAFCADGSVADFAASAGSEKIRWAETGGKVSKFRPALASAEPKELIELSILAGFQSSGTFRSIRMILFHDQNVSVRG